ncbi:uncharacterized protein MONBRDRAFT_36002 [Monosiga brevicollis MX1]|uniref:Uncharacterized protein n=1 Tax=Monosiga brevicollis TaxID=81824 RepID=A9UR96_MONBE|nr:uncharacterized protein MONBRDRAFT_36002 [Monosiga brevicollis MX1]EDQ92204.1 predicted protein [Monosiga brevicollis MX1]|eukprot:XP_001743490.1 hypothetical protein [Monosiga brevicollis MX1]
MPLHFKVCCFHFSALPIRRLFLLSVGRKAENEEGEQMARLTERVQELEEEKQRLSHDLQRATTQTRELEARIAASDHDMQELERKLIKERETADYCRTQADDLAKQLQSRDEQSESSKAELRAQHAAKLAALEADLTAAHEQIEELQQQNEATNAELAQKAAEAARLHEAHAAAEARLATTIDQMATLERRHERLQSFVRAATTTLIRAHAKSGDELRAQLAASETRATKAEALLATQQHEQDTRDQQRSKDANLIKELRKQLAREQRKQDSASMVTTTSSRTSSPKTARRSMHRRSISQVSETSQATLRSFETDNSSEAAKVVITHEEQEALLDRMTALQTDKAETEDRIGCLLVNIWLGMQLRRSLRKLQQLEAQLAKKSTLLDTFALTGEATTSAAPSSSKAAKTNVAALQCVPCLLLASCHPGWSCRMSHGRHHSRPCAHFRTFRKDSQATTQCIVCSPAYFSLSESDRMANQKMQQLEDDLARTTCPLMQTTVRMASPVHPGYAPPPPPPSAHLKHGQDENQGADPCLTSAAPAGHRASRAMRLRRLSVNKPKPDYTPPTAPTRSQSASGAVNRQGAFSAAMGRRANSVAVPGSTHKQHATQVIIHHGKIAQPDVRQKVTDSHRRIIAQAAKARIDRAC